MLKQFIGLVFLGFNKHASGTRLTIVFDIVSETRPSILSTNKVNCLGLAIVARKDMIMLVL